MLTRVRIDFAITAFIDSRTLIRKSEVIAIG
jgi:hypothetical protein